MNSLKYWTVEDFEIASYKWSISDRKNLSINGNASDTSGKRYTFNEHGFRGDSLLSSGIKIMSVGCSHTEGIGVNDNETWSHLLSRKIKDGIDINLGISGRSNDYIARTILTWTDYIQPSIVLIMYTYPHRKEYYTESGNIEPFHPSPWGYFLEDEKGSFEWEHIIKTLNSEENFINWYKNHLLISMYLKNKNIPFIWNGTFLQTGYTDDNRFDGNYPKLIDNHQHATALDNLDYANNLYNLIKTKFNIY